MNVLKKTMKLWEAYTAPKKRIDTPQNVAGSKVYMPDYGRCEYNCLEELILDLRHNSGSCERYNLFLDHIVQYNIRFRDSLRAMGIEGVIETLIAECPSLTNEEKELNKLRSWWKERMHEHIADYDIQCYPRDAILYLCGCPFNGLSDIGSQIEMSASGKYRWNEDRVYLRKDFKPNTFGLHVGSCGRATLHLTPMMLQMAGAMITSLLENDLLVQVT